MTAADLRAEVRRTLRLDIAAARERAELVDALEGSVLWLRLLKPVEGECVECGHITEDMHDGDCLHDDCNAALVREQELDKFLDDPRHGQAAELNRCR